MTNQELISALQNEVRILLHLAGKIDPRKPDYRPTQKQRSTIELLRYLSIMGPFWCRPPGPDGIPRRGAQRRKMRRPGISMTPSR